METKINKARNLASIIEAVLVFAISIPVLSVGMGMVILFLFLLFELINYGIDIDEVVGVLFSIQFIAMAVFNVIAVINMVQSLSYYKNRPIKSYQCRIKSFMNMRNMLIFAVIADLLVASDSLSGDVGLGIRLFIILILIPFLVIRWRLNENTNTLRILVKDDLKSKRE